MKRVITWSAAFVLAAAMGAIPVQAQGAKRVVIDKNSQILRAYEGKKLVFQTRVSTGKRGKETPTGRFRAGPKYRMHYSSRYNNAPMPYSVVVSGHYFIHGYTEVPNRPASRGCIRLPLNNGNPARWFYNWVRPGTPIRIVGHWPGSTPRGSFETATILRASPVY